MRCRRLYILTGRRYGKLRASTEQRKCAKSVEIISDAKIYKMHKLRL